jgi:hypothetical protein
MKTENLLIIGGAVVLGGLYLSNKSKKDKANAKALADAQALALADAQALALANAQSQNPKVEPTEDLTGFYNTTEATKKALEVVTKWISLLDSIPKEALKEESKNVIRERVLAEEDVEEFDMEALLESHCVLDEDQIVDIIMIDIINDVQIKI